MENEELISIVIPVYNVKNYLENCLDSVLNQTYKNIEIILVNDGSTDESNEICKKYAKIDKRISLINKENGGLSDARNVGVKSSKGDFITFIDSDDEVDVSYVEYLYDLCKEFNADIASCSHKVLKNHNEINQVSKGESYRKYFNPENALDEMLCDKAISIAAWAKLYKKRLFDSISFPVGKICEDNGTTYKLILNSNGVAVGNSVNYYYFKRKNSIMTINFNFKKKDLIFLTDIMCDEIFQIYPELKDSLEKKKIESRFSLLRQIECSNNPLVYKELEKEVISYILERKKEILVNPKTNIREKAGLLSLLMGKKTFKFTWNVYSFIKYRNWRFF